MLTSLKRMLLIGTVICGVVLIFVRLSSPYEIKPQPPEQKMLQYQKEFHTYLKQYDMSNKKEREAAETVRFVYCRFAGVGCDDNWDVYSTENFDKSFIGKTAGLFSTPFANPPASGTYYVMHSLQQAGFVPKAEAVEGLGFAGLAPFISIWKKLRDIAFLIIALAMVLSGFMILFRTRMDPQNVIKLENALPKIILTMVLINFSFAIAGFMIDIMYILSGLVIVTFGPLISPSLNIATLLDKYLHPGTYELAYLASGNFEGTFSGFWSAIKELAFTLPIAITGMFGEAFRALFMLLAGGFLFIRLGAKWSGIVWSLAAQGTNAVPLLPYAVAAIVLFFTLPAIFIASVALPFLLVGGAILITFAVLIIQLLIMIFKTYIKLLLYVVLSPFIILLEAVPGSTAFIPWLQTIFVELLTFPAILAIFFLSGAFRGALSNGALLRLPFMSGPLNPESLGAIIGFGILFMMPKLIADMKKKLNTQTVSAPGVGLPFFAAVSKPIQALTKPRGLYAASEFFGPLGDLVKRSKLLQRYASLGKGTP